MKTSAKNKHTQEKHDNRCGRGGGVLTSRNVEERRGRRGTHRENVEGRRGTSRNVEDIEGCTDQGATQQTPNKADTEIQKSNRF